MQALITIDFGNTHPHAGIFIKDQANYLLEKVIPWEKLSDELDLLGLTPHNTQLVLAEVKSRENELQPLLHHGYLLTRIKDYWRGQKFAGMPVQYAHTLGEDRLIEAYYIFKNVKSSALLIDAGTFTTMDIVTKQGFEGGYIFPSFKNYLSLFQMGEQLRNVQLETQISSELPHTTQEAMQNSYLAFFALAKELIKLQSLEKVIVTGGQAPTWYALFKQSCPDITVEFHPNLIHSSIMYWMTTQVSRL